MEMKDWLILSKLGEKRTISEVSKEVFMSQPALTYRINNIEKELELKLFTRNKKGIVPNKQGEIIINYAKKMISEWENVKANIYSSAKLVKGILKIGASPAISQFILPKLLSSFITDYPEIEFKLVTGFSDDLTEKFSTNEIDIAFLRDNISIQKKKKLVSKEHIYVVSLGEIDITDLPNLTRIEYTTNISLRMLIDRWWEERYNIPPKNTMKVDGLETSLKFIREGLGYAILPGLCLSESPDLNKVKMQFINRTSLERSTWLYTSETSSQKEIIELFLEYMDNFGAFKQTW
ncbi:LysR family transcriptional regulator [Fredinandcohnia onubensis]|uniref:LysR family transcriptional regulator n=1 Tax=Fredinandcohnia onubensis TaxID=1571209 RepID=UPI000C0BECB8|nr:LysR family transcriptional regulator [Fredinandcohnia onubensis]